MNSSPSTSKECEDFSRYLTDPTTDPSQVLWDHLEHCPFCQSKLVEWDKGGKSASFASSFKNEIELAREIYSTGWTFPATIASRKHQQGELELPPEIPGYEMLEIIGSGTSGIVWKSVQQGLNRSVALKIMKADSEVSQKRLEKEGKILASIQHRCLLAIHDTGSWNGKAWMALEYCPGGSLNKYLTHLWEPQKAARLVSQVAMAAHAVHEKGIVHRDIKPGNILMGLDGLPRLADFDLARNPHASQDMTQTGQIMGTPAYIAPEQVKGQTVDRRADVHALGAVLYHLLTGRAPFRADSTYEALLLAAHSEPIAPIKIRANLPPDLDQVCQKCLDKDPSERYSTAEELAADLDRYLTDQPVLARPLSAPRIAWRWAKRNKALAITGFVGILALIMVAVISTGAALQATAYATSEREFNKELQSKTILAMENEEKANQEAQRALENEKKALSELYVNRINQAQMNFDNANPMVAQNFLDQCPFGLRRWEHHYLNTLIHANQYDLEGHTDKVKCTALSHDGKWIASGGEDKRVIIWELQTGNQITNYTGHNNPVTNVAFSPTGLQVASGGFDCTVQIWNPLTGARFGTLDCQGEVVFGLSFFPDGERICATTSHGNCFIWSLKNFQLIKKISVDKESVFGVAFDKAGDVLALGGDGKNLLLYDAKSYKLKEVHKGNRSIKTLQFHPNGKTLVSSHGEEMVGISLWDLKTGLKPVLFRGNKDAVNGVVFTPDGAKLLSVTADRRIMMWSAKDGTILGEWKGHFESITSCCIGALGNLLITSGSDRIVKIWNLENQYFFKHINQGNNFYVNCLKEIPNTNQLVAGTQRGTLQIFQKENLNLVQSLEAHAGPVLAMDVLPDGQMMVTGGSDSRVNLWDWKAGKIKAAFLGHTGKVTQVLFDPLQQQVLSGSEDSTVQIWDISSEKLAGTFEKHQHKKITGLARYPGPSGTRVISSDDSGRIFVWDSKSQKILKELFFGSSIRSMALSQKFDNLIIACEDKNIYCVEIKNNFTTFLFANHNTLINYISFSSDDQSFVTSDCDWKIRLWEGRSKKVVLTLSDHTDIVNQATFSHDGQTLYSCGNDRSIRSYSGRLKDPRFLANGGLAQFDTSMDKTETTPSKERMNFGFSQDSSQMIQMDDFGHWFSTEILSGIGKSGNVTDLAPGFFTVGQTSPDQRWKITSEDQGFYLADKSVLLDYQQKRSSDLAQWTKSLKNDYLFPLPPFLPGQRVGQGSVNSSGTGEGVGNDSAFAALKSDGSVITWGNAVTGGDSNRISAQIQGKVIQIYSTSQAFAALKKDGSVVSWGNPQFGGDLSGVKDSLQSGVIQISSTSQAFAALKKDGSVVAWGNPEMGGDISGIKDQLQKGVISVFSNSQAFSAIKADGSVISWGSSGNGGESSHVASQLKAGVIRVFGNGYAFAALKSNGSVVTWGNPNYGGNSSKVAYSLNSGVTNVFSTANAFAALKSDGSVLTWGDAGGDSDLVAWSLQSGVVNVFANRRSFAALKKDGSVVTWGSLGEVAPKIKTDPELKSGVVAIFSNEAAFAALKNDGSLSTWGYGPHGGDISQIQGQLRSGVVQVFATGTAFAALKADGSVVGWGAKETGGDISSVASALRGGVKTIYANQRAFAALKEDGSLVIWGDPLAGGDSSSVASKLTSGIIGLSSPFLQSPWFVSPQEVVFEVGKFREFSVVARGLPQAVVFKIVSGSLPPGISFDAQKGLLQGTPASTAKGKYPVQIGANNGVGLGASQNLTIEIR